MRLLTIIAALLIITGCSPPVSVLAPVNESRFDVVLSDYISESLLVNGTAVDRISFRIKNNESFSLDCIADFKVVNKTNSVEKKGQIGIIEPGTQKKVSVVIEMLNGDSEMRINPVCIKSSAG